MILQYLLDLLHSSQHLLLRFLLRLAYYLLPSWLVRTQTPIIIPKARPTALPPIRPRALTALPNPRTTPPSPEPSPTTYTQLQSPFFNLPLEIRRLIYRHTLTSGVTHIVRLGPRLGHVRCRDLHLERPWFHRCWGITVKGSDLYHGPHDDFLNDDDDVETQDLLPLLMACRRIYTEAIQVLYGDTTFSMRHLADVDLFAATILPQRLNTVRSVELGWSFYFPYPPYTRKLHYTRFDVTNIDAWERVWSILANMEGLRKLRVDLVGRWIEPLTAEEETRMLGPAMKVQRPRVWNIRVDWQCPGLDWEAEGAPFRVTRDARTVTDVSSEH